MPRTVTLDTTQLAKLINVNPRTVRKLAGEGILERARDEVGEEIQGRWEMIKNNHAYIAYLKEQGKWDDSSETKRAILTNRRIAAEAELAELRLLQFKGKLHRADDVATFVTNMIGRFKSRSQAIAARVSRSLVGVTSERTIRRTIGDEVDLALRELSVPDEASFAEANEAFLEAQGAGAAMLAELSNGQQPNGDGDGETELADT